MVRKLSAVFNRTVKTYATLYFNMKEVDYGPDGRGPDSETVDIAKLGLASVADLHAYVRRNKLYEGYDTHQVSTVVAGGRKHYSGEYNKTPKIWFGTIQPAEDLKIVNFKEDEKGDLVRADEPYVQSRPDAKGRFFVRTDGWTIQVLEDKDQVFDKVTNQKLWPRQDPQPGPRPAS